MSLQGKNAGAAKLWTLQLLKNLPESASKQSETKPNAISSAIPYERDDLADSETLPQKNVTCINSAETQPRDTMNTYHPSHPKVIDNKVSYITQDPLYSRKQNEKKSPIEARRRAKPELPEGRMPRTTQSKSDEKDKSKDSPQAWNF